MKVLFIVPRIYEPYGGKFVKNNAGLELYVHKIVESLKDDVDAYVLTHSFGTEETINGIHYASHTKKDVLSGVTPKRILKAIKAFFACHGSVKKRIKTAFFEFDYGYYEKYIKKLNPDIVHFHACARGIFDNIKAVRKQKIPLVITLHGLIGLDASVDAGKELTYIERRIFCMADKERIPITVISSGIKERAVAGYGLKDPSNITVIMNGTDIASEASKCCDSAELCKRFDISDKKRTIICVGSLGANKNQEAVVKAFNQIPKEQRENWQLLLAGQDNYDGQIQRLIGSLGLCDSVYALGFVDPSEIAGLYELSELNVLASKCEGFGLSIIEAMAYGVPTVTYCDLDAVTDIYTEESVEDTAILLNDRSTEALANGIVCAMNKDWDSAKIIAMSDRFTMSEISRQYLKKYVEQIDGRGVNA